MIPSMDDMLSLGRPADAFEQILTKPLQWHDFKSSAID